MLGLVERMFPYNVRPRPSQRQDGNLVLNVVHTALRAIVDIVGGTFALKDVTPEHLTTLASSVLEEKIVD